VIFISSAESSNIHKDKLLPSAGISRTAAAGELRRFSCKENTPVTAGGKACLSMITQTELKGPFRTNKKTHSQNNKHRNHCGSKF